MPEIVLLQKLPSCSSYRDVQEVGARSLAVRDRKTLVSVVSQKSVVTYRIPMEFV